MVKKYALCFLFLLLELPFLKAQSIALKVEEASNAQQLVNALLGAGVEISNVAIKGSIRQTGTFDNPIGAVGVRKGVVLTTGDVRVADGPNDNCIFSNQNGGGCFVGGVSTTFDFNVIDPKLNDIAQSQGSGSYFDAVILEFDFVPKGNKISFRYVMGSEEYIEDDEGFPDMFGFFISGPGFPVETNLAKVPGTNQVVTTATINDKINSGLYNDNGAGDQPLVNALLGYDGYTDVLTAEADVIPCEKYRLRFAIADANDQQKDSGVFIEEGSFNAVFTPVLSVEFESPLDTIFEGCADAEISVNNPFPVPFDLPLALSFSGTADNDDFIDLPDLLTIPTGQTSTSFNFESILDEVEGIENLEVKVSPVCDKLFELDLLVIPVNDNVVREISDFEWCNEDTIALNGFGNDYDQLVFNPSTYVSCNTCNNPSVYLIAQDTISYTYTETITGCNYSDSFAIRKFIPEFEYEIGDNEFYTKLDLEGRIISSNLDNFAWDFSSKELLGDTVLYNAGNLNTDSVCVPVVITGFQDSLACELKKDSLFCIIDNLVFPNIFTPNGDGINDFFEVEGIVSGNWDFDLFNRYGQLIFSEENYDFDFNAQDVSDGVYFYSIKNKFGDRVFKGWVQIVR